MPIPASRPREPLRKDDLCESRDSERPSRRDLERDRDDESVLRREVDLDLESCILDEDELPSSRRLVDCDRERYIRRECLFRRQSVIEMSFDFVDGERVLFSQGMEPPVVVVLISWGGSEAGDSLV